MGARSTMGEHQSICSTHMRRALLRSLSDIERVLTVLCPAEMIHVDRPGFCTASARPRPAESRVFDGRDSRAANGITEGIIMAVMAAGALVLCSVAFAPPQPAGSRGVASAALASAQLARPEVGRAAAAHGLARTAMSSSGFGEKKIKGKADAPKKSGAYEKLRKTGQPEYDLFVRAEEGAEWMPAGAMVVPRTSSVLEAVSRSIYTREAELCAAVARQYPKLLPADADPATLQFGFRLAEFPDDPVVQADRSKTVDEKNFFSKFLDDLNNPLNSEDATLPGQ